MADKTIENSTRWIRMLKAVPETAEHHITHVLPNSWREPGYEIVSYGQYCHGAANCISELIQRIETLEERLRNHT